MAQAILAQARADGRALGARVEHIASFYRHARRSAYRFLIHIRIATAKHMNRYAHKPSIIRQNKTSIGLQRYVRPSASVSTAHGRPDRTLAPREALPVLPCVNKQNDRKDCRSNVISSSFDYSRCPLESRSPSKSAKQERLRLFNNRIKYHRVFYRTLKRHLAVKKGLSDQHALSYFTWSQESTNQQMQSIKTQAKHHLITKSQRHYKMVYTMTTTKAGNIKSSRRHFQSKSQIPSKPTLQIDEHSSLRIHSLNTKGLGITKRQCLEHTFKSHNMDLFFLQETRVRDCCLESRSNLLFHFSSTQNNTRKYERAGVGIVFRESLLPYIREI